MPVLTAAAIVLLVTGAAIYLVIVYNGLVRLQNEIGRAWANIDVLLKQRHDEVPNLVACVKGYMDHERQTLEAVTLARAASINAASIPQKAQADALLTSALRSFLWWRSGIRSSRPTRIFRRCRIASPNWRSESPTGASFLTTTSTPTTRVSHSSPKSSWRG
jgi:hypothetical protein